MSAGEQNKGVRVSGNIVDGLLAYLRRTVGDAATRDLLTAAEVDFELNEPAPPWVLARDVNRLAEIAETRLPEPELGRRTGEEMFRLRPDAFPFYRAAGTVAGGLKQAIGLGSRTRSNPPFEFLEESNSHLVVKATNPKSSRFACGISLGYWSQVPTLFGTVAAAIEPKCVTRGDPHCEFRVTWDPVDLTANDGRERSLARGNSLISRFEELLNLASDLTAQPTLDDLLHTIAERAVSAVLTPGIVIGVRFGPNEPMTVGWSGLDEARAHELAHAADMGVIDDETVGVVPISSPRQHYGHLIAVTPAEVPFSGPEMRMLSSYAGHATAAIESTAALAEARAARDSAEALLGLARKLSGVGSTQEIAQRIAEAVPLLVECQFSIVMTLDRATGELTFSGSWPHPVESLGVEVVKLADAPAARLVIDSCEAVFSPAEQTEGLLRSLLRVANARSVAIAPVVIRDAAVGLVVAASTKPWSETAAAPVLHRLSGLADHAATAFDNSRLLHRVQHQALHDSLTGLPNRTLVKDRVEHALVLAERADRWVTVLFIDIDQFKEINDEFGHAAGDQVLRVVAGRLAECVRASDTVARLGGDEFLVLLENTCGVEDGARVAETITSRLREPIVLPHGELVVSASVGVTSGSGRDSSYDQLLAAADQAMYEVKRSGRNGWKTFALGSPNPV